MRVWRLGASQIEILAFCTLISLALLPSLVLGADGCFLRTTTDGGEKSNPSIQSSALPKIDSRIMASDMEGKNETIQVVFELTENKSEYMQALREEGIVVQSIYDDLIQGLAFPQQILRVEGFEFIRCVRPPECPVPLGVISEGVNVVQANLTPKE